MTRQACKLCSVCGTRPAAMSSVEFCFTCWPHGPVTPPPCVRCGSTINYFTNGVCSRCHHHAKAQVDTCPDCYAWGATRNRGWYCTACSGWRQYHTVGTCVCCGRDGLPLNDDDGCRLCVKERTRKLAARPFPLIDLHEANRDGQQLFLADMSHNMSGTPRPKQPRVRPVLAEAHIPVLHSQLVLFDWPHDLQAANRAGFPQPDPHLAQTLSRHVEEHGDIHGWGHAHRMSVRRGTRILLVMQPTPGNVVSYSDVAQLAQIGLSVPAVAAVLQRAGMLHDDREPPVVGWFARKTVDLPPGIRDELSIWFDIMRNGSTIAPRRQPRSNEATTNFLRYALPAIQTWASTHDSLRAITPDDIRIALPTVGYQRAHMLQGLRSIFGVLKGRQIIFVNPTARIHQKGPNHPIPKAVDITTLRAALDSPDPACAGIAALLCFHAIRVQHLRLIRVTHIADGHLTIDNRKILLAPQVRQRVAAYLDYRNTTWPNTINPHLFVNRRTVTHTRPAHGHWCTQTLGLPAQMIRQDRILNEALATGGDLRQLAEMFGLSVGTAGIYANHAHATITAEGIV
jgi:hypothetical protein